MLGRTWWRRLGLEKMKKRKKTRGKIRRYAFVRLNIFGKMMIWEEGGDPEMKQKWRSRIVLSVLWQKRPPLGVRTSFQAKSEDPQMSFITSVTSSNKHAGSLLYHSSLFFLSGVLCFCPSHSFSTQPLPSKNLPHTAVLSTLLNIINSAFRVCFPWHKKRKRRTKSKFFLTNWLFGW